MRIRNKLPMYIAVQLESCDGKRVWLPLPAHQARFAEAVEKIDGGFGYFSIKDYATKVPWLSINKAMKTPLSVMNYLASRLNKLDDNEILKLCAIADSDHFFDRVGEIIDYTFRTDCYRLLPGITDEEALGFYHINDPKTYLVDVVRKQCIDRREFGKKLAKAEKGVFTPHGYLTSSIGWDLPPSERRVPDSLNLKGYLGEDLFGNWQEYDPAT